MSDFGVTGGGSPNARTLQHCLSKQTLRRGTTRLLSAKSGFDARRARGRLDIRAEAGSWLKALSDGDSRRRVCACRCGTHNWKMAGSVPAGRNLAQRRHRALAQLRCTAAASVKRADVGRRVDRAARLTRKADPLLPTAGADLGHGRQQRLGIWVRRAGKYPLVRPAVDEMPERSDKD